MTYKDDCISTGINELPNSWCYPGQFRVLARINWGDFRAVGRNPGFNVKPVITHSIISVVKTDRDFASAPSIVGAAVSDAKVINQFISAPSIIIATVSDANTDRTFGVAAAIYSDISSDSSSARALASAAAIGFATSNANIHAINQFASTPLFQTNAVSGVNLFNSFASSAAIAWDITDDAALDYINQFGSTASIVSAVASDIDSFRSFVCGAAIGFNLACDGPNLLRDFSVAADIDFVISDVELDYFYRVASTANIISDIDDVALQVTRCFASQADIVSDITDPVFERTWAFASTADIVSDISDISINLNRVFASTANIVSIMYSEMPDSRRYLSQADIVSAITDPAIVSEVLFTSQADIVFDTTDPVWEDGGGAELPAFDNKLRIVIPASSVGEDLTNFPVRINIDQNENVGINSADISQIIADLGMSYDAYNTIAFKTAYQDNFSGDDFTGADDDPPNPNLWSYVSGYTGYPYTTIQSNKLEFDPPADNANYITRLQSMYSLTGDFDIQIDFDHITFTEPTSGTDVSYLPNMLIRKVSDDAAIAYLQRRNYVSVDGDDYNGWGTDISSTQAEESHSSGKLRITRINGEIKLYYWDSQWEWDDNTAGLIAVNNNTDEVYIEIWFEQATNGNVNGTVDNFLINSGTIVWPIVDRFTGADDDAPNSALWTEADPANYLSIQSNKLNFTSPVADANPSADVKSRFVLTGDFDIQVDFSITSWDVPTDSLTYAAQLQVIGIGGTLGSVCLSYYSSGNKLYRGGGVESGTITYATTDMSGQFRITRVSGVTRGFIWDTVSARWEFDGGTTGYLIDSTDTSDLTIQLRFESENNSGLNSNVDNLVINSGTVVWPDAPGIYRENQYKIGVTKADEETQQFVEIENVGNTKASWLGEWKYRKKIKLPYFSIDGTLTNFPVTLRLATNAGRRESDLTEIFTELGANSLKLALTTDDGLTQTYIEIEKWDEGNNRATIHFLAPTLSNTVDNYFYLYYDSVQLDNTAYVGAIGSTPGEAVWDSNYKLVCHMAEDPTGTVQDSSGNNDLVGSGMASGDLVYDTDLGHWCLDFDGSNDNLRSNSNGINPSTNDWTHEFIYKKDPGVADDMNLLSQEDGGGTGRSLVTIDSNGTNKMYTYASGAPTFSNLAVGDSVWLAIAASFLNSSNAFKWYWNGDIDESSTISPNSMAGRYRIGTHKLANQQWFNGRISEFRISQVTRSAEWIKASQDSLFDNLVTWYDALEYESPTEYEPSFVLNTKVPLISSTIDTVMWLHWDSTLTIDDNTEYVGVVGEAPAQNVWNDDYVFVTHLNNFADESTKGYNAAYDGNDDFTGEDGDAPNPDLWVETDPSALMAIKNNALHYDTNGFAGSDIISQVISRYTLQGDFDIEVRFWVTTLTSPDTSQTYAARLEVLGIAEAIIGQIAFGKNENGSKYYNYEGEDVSFGTGGAQQEWDGWLRITRASGVVTVFHKDDAGTQWEWDGDTDGFIVANSNTDDLNVRLFFKARTGSDLDTNIGAIDINSGTVVWPLIEGTPVHMDDSDIVAGLNNGKAIEFYGAERINWGIRHANDIPLLTLETLFKSVGSLGTLVNKAVSDVGWSFRISDISDSLLFQRDSSGGLGSWNDGTNTILVDNWNYGAVTQMLDDEAYTVIAFKSAFQDDFTGDDFTGDDGTAPNPAVWYEFKNDGSFTSIQNNKLNYNSGGVVGSTQSGRYDSWFRLSGDFDIQIDFDIVSMTAPSTAFNYAARMLVMNDAGTVVVAELSKGMNTTGDHEYNRDGEDVSPVTHDDSDLTGKLRLTRINGEIKCYHWTSSQWEWNGNTAGVIVTNNNTEDVLVVMFLSARDDASMHSNIDNFLINSGTIVWPLADRFTGDDDDSPNSDLWTNTRTYAAFINNNKLRCACSGAGTCGAASKFWLIGDFDIRVDWDEIVGPNTNRWDAIFKVTPQETPNSYFQVFRAYSTNTGNHFGANKKTNGAFGTVGTVTSSLTTSKLRIKRVGTTLTGYFWNGSGWTTIRSDTWLNEDCKIDFLSQSSGSNPATTSDFDNFTIISGTVFWPLIYFAPNFQLNDVAGTPVEITAPSGTWDSDAPATLNIGNTGDEDVGFDGLLGELRISRVIRSEGWRTATFKTLNDQLNVYGYHEQRMQVLVDSSLVDEELTNFPLPISLNNSSAPELFAALTYPDPTGDYLTGEDGTSPNPILWTWAGDTGPLFNNNKIRMSIADGAGDGNQTMTAKFHMVGDFNVQVDFDAISGIDTGGNGGQVGLYIKDPLDGSTWARMTMNTFNGDFLRQSQVEGGQTGSSSIGNNTYYTGLSYRIRRVGSQVYIAVYYAGSWKEVGPYTFTSDNMMVQLYAAHWTDNPSFVCDFDDFAINSGTIMWPNGTHPNRKKIRVAGHDGVSLNTELDFSDIENDNLVLHTLVPVISASLDTELFIYFDAEADDTPEVGDIGEAAAQAVWDSNFIAVLHMSDPIGNNVDSTGNGHDAADLGTILLGGGSPQMGQFKTISSLASANRIEIPDNAELRGMAAVTIEAMFKLNFEVDWGQVWEYSSDITNNLGRKFRLYMNDAEPRQLTAGIWNTSNGAIQQHTFDYNFSTWSHIGVKYGSGTMKTMYQGAIVGNTTGLSGTVNNDGAGDLILGRHNYNTYNMAVAYSEFRLSNIDRSDAWMKATYFGLILNYTLLDINYDAGAGIDFASTANITTATSSDIIKPNWLITEGSVWEHRLKIVIDNTKIGEDLTNFPLLVAINNISGSGINNYDASHFFAEVSNSFKVAFTLADGLTQLYAEKDYTNVAGGKCAWHVKIPSILQAIDTEIFMYYDDTKADNTTYIASLYDGGNVWDSDFVGVWHNNYYSPLSDSTSNNRDLTPSGIYAADDDYDMRYGKAIESDSGGDRYTAPGEEALRIVGDITLEILLKRDKADSVNSYMIECAASGESEVTNVNYCLLFNATSQKLHSFWEYGSGGAWGGVDSTFTLFDTSGVHYVAMARDVAAKTLNYHLDENSEIRGYPNNPSKAGSGNQQILRFHNNHVYNRCYVGKMGEIRISKIVRSDHWLHATNFTLDDNTNTITYETL